MIVNTNGITIRQLKEYIKDLPEVDDFGDEYEVWIANGNYSNVAKEIRILNKGDIIIDWEV